MANGETLREIREMLASEEKMSSPVVQRLTLSLVAEIYEAQKGVAEALKMATRAEDIRHAKIDEDLATIKNKSIVIWLERNKAVSAMISVLVFIVFLVGQSIAVPAIAKALGVPLP